MLRPEIPERGYNLFPMTGVPLSTCRQCGALVGDEELHDVWHEDGIDGEAIVRAIRKTQRTHGRRSM